MGFLRQGKPKKITDHNERYMSASCIISIRLAVGADDADCIVNADTIVLMMAAFIRQSVSSRPGKSVC
jgi:hypothetical protein